IISYCRFELAPSHGATQPKIAHQPLHGAACRSDVLTIELPPHLADTIDPEVLVPYAPNVDFQFAIALHTRWNARWVDFPRFVLVVRRRGNWQLPANRLDPVFVAMLVDEPDHDFPRRSSSAWAKNAEALRRISLARRNSWFSRSRAFS